MQQPSLKPILSSTPPSCATPTAEFPKSAQLRILSRTTLSNTLTSSPQPPISENSLFTPPFPPSGLLHPIPGTNAAQSTPHVTPPSRPPVSRNSTMLATIPPSPAPAQKSALGVSSINPRSTRTSSFSNPSTTSQTSPSPSNASTMAPTTRTRQQPASERRI